MKTKEKSIKIYPKTHKKILKLKEITRLTIKNITHDAIELMEKRHEGYDKVY